MPESDDVKEVYARFGLAYYHGEVLHRGLCNLYALSSLPESGVTGPRLAELLGEAYTATLGRVVNLVSHLFGEAELAELRAAVDARNFLAHHFWFERIHLLATDAGIAAAIRELDEYTAQFSALDAQTESMIAPYNDRVGLTPERLDEAMAAVKRGEDSEPLLRQRRPKKEEVILRAYEVPTIAGGQTLIFQTDDLELWQLCDVGLGWTAYDRVEEEWQVASAVAAHLPAHVNPRPLTNGPWNYDLFLGRGVSLKVRPGPGKDQFLWSIAEDGRPTRR